ncbi:MAG: acyltransferase family protein [Acidobacteria bacterium]|nr:acyltransferase family protein [Acidobacteriota bacterium]
MTAVSTREYGLDWLRVIAFSILIFYHTGMFFVPWDWHVKNPETSQPLTYVMMFFNRWRLPLLFLISGAGVFFSLRRRTFQEFAGERLRRLGIPLAFGMLAVVPPQIYFERLYRHQFNGSYFEFWPSVLNGVPYPQGNTSWHHLWFVVYILVFSVLCIPIFVALKSAAGRRAVDALAGFCEKPGAVYLINIPNIIVALVLSPHWPTTHNLVADWANLTGSLLTFLWGFVICGSGRFLDLITRRRREYLIFALAMTVVFYTVHRADLLSRILVDSYFTLGWILTAIGYSRAYLNRESAFLTYATEAVYPFYIAHQTVTVAIAYYMVPWNAPISVKLPLLALGTFLGSWMVFEIVKRTALTRLLFGLRHTG